MISEQITQGVERAPQRSLLYAAGFTEDEIKKPLIGVVSAQSEIIPGHMHLSKIAEAVKAGIYASGGTPVGCLPLVCAMASSWDIVECTIPWHPVN